MAEYYPGCEFCATDTPHRLPNEDESELPDGPLREHIVTRIQEVGAAETPQSPRWEGHGRIDLLTGEQTERMLVIDQPILVLPAVEENYARAAVTSVVRDLRPQYWTENLREDPSKAPTTRSPRKGAPGGHDYAASARTAVGLPPPEAVIGSKLLAKVAKRGEERAAMMTDALDRPRGDHPEHHAFGIAVVMVWRGQSGTWGIRIGYVLLLAVLPLICG